MAEVVKGIMTTTRSAKLAFLQPKIPCIPILIKDIGGVFQHAIHHLTHLFLLNQCRPITIPGFGYPIQIHSHPHPFLFTSY